jgi:hypothetical protein
MIVGKPQVRTMVCILKVTFLGIIPFFITLKFKCMKKNVGSGDQAIRTLLAAIIIVLYFSNIVSGTIGIVLLALAGVLIATSMAGFCPVYTLLGMNTNEVKKA